MRTRIHPYLKSLKTVQAYLGKTLPLSTCFTQQSFLRRFWCGSLYAKGNRKIELSISC